MGPTTNQTENRTRNGHVLVWEQTDIETEEVKQSKCLFFSLFNRIKTMQMMSEKNNDFFFI